MASTFTRCAMHQTDEVTYTNDPALLKTDSSVCSRDECQPLNVTTEDTDDDEIRDSLLRARGSFICFMIFDALMVVNHCMQLWCILYAPDSASSHFLLGDHFDASTGATFTAIGLVFTTCCFMCDIVLGFVMMKCIDAVVSNLDSKDWASLRCAAEWNWNSNLLTLVVWTIVKMKIFQHADSQRLLGFVIVVFVRCVKLRPLKHFRDGLIEADDSGSSRYLVAAWPAPQDSKEKRVLACTVAGLVALAMFVIGALVVNDEMQNRDGYGVVAVGQKELAPTRLYSTGIFGQSNVTTMTPAPCSGDNCVKTQAQPALCNGDNCTKPQAHPSLCNGDNCTKPQAHPSLCNGDDCTKPQAHPSTCIGGGCTKPRAPQSGFLSTSVPPLHPAMTSETTTLYSQDPTARRLSYFQSLNQGGYRWYCNDKQCGSNYIAKHAITHKVAKAAIAGGSAAAAAGGGCAAAAGGPFDPVGATAAGSTCYIIGGIASALAGGTALVEESTDDECIDECGDNVPDYVFHKLLCTPMTCDK